MLVGKGSAKCFNIYIYDSEERFYGGIIMVQLKEICVLTIYVRSWTVDHVFFLPLSLNLFKNLTHSFFSGITFKKIPISQIVTIPEFSFGLDHFWLTAISSNLQSNIS